MYACICHAVSERELAHVIAAGADTPEAVGRACGAGTGCGSCLDRICTRLSMMDGLRTREPAEEAMVAAS